MRNPEQIAQFGERLKQLRKKAGLTQDALAYEAEVAVKSIYLMEHGEQAATLDVLFSLAKVLQVTPAEMLKGIAVPFED